MQARHFKWPLMGSLLIGALAMGTPVLAATASTADTTLAVNGGGDTVSILGLPTDRGLMVQNVLGSSYDDVTWPGDGTTSATDDIFQIDDATGTGAGWTLSIQATPVTEITPASGFASNTTALVLPAWSLELGQVGDIVAESSQPASEEPTITSLSSGYTAFADGTPVTLATAGTGTGEGTWGFRWPKSSTMFTLSLPVDSQTVDLINYPTQPTPYNSTITVTMTEN